MAFPFTHLCVAFELLKARPMPDDDAALFMLGNIAPDGVHYRKTLVGSQMKKIGPAKKITHLCPVSDEVWGAVTDNDGWILRVRDFFNEHPPSPLYLGYATHVLTDIQNNLTLWTNFRINFPHEAAKGYTSDYYVDMKQIDMRLYQSTSYTEEAMGLLLKAEAQSDICWNNELLAAASEMEAIKLNLIHENYKNAEENINPDHKYKFVTCDDMQEFIRNTTETITAAFF